MRGAGSYRFLNGDYPQMSKLESLSRLSLIPLEVAGFFYRFCSK